MVLSICRNHDPAGCVAKIAFTFFKASLISRAACFSFSGAGFAPFVIGGFGGAGFFTAFTALMPLLGCFFLMAILLTPSVTNSHV